MNSTNRVSAPILIVVVSVFCELALSCFAQPLDTYALHRGVPIFVDTSEAGPILVAIADLQRDLQKVLGGPSDIVYSEPSSGPALVVTCHGAATAACRDPALTKLESHQLKARMTTGGPRIVLQGADVRGTIYAIYEFSDRILDAPPLWYWASSPPRPQPSILVPTNLDVRINSPAVPYRTLFPNDTDMLSPWMSASTNNYNALFETLLRLKYNVLDVDHISDVGGANSGLRWARTCRDRGIIVTYTHYAALGGSIADYGAIVGGQPNVTNIAGLETFWTHYINLAASNRINEVIQSIVFRGRGDSAWWRVIGGDPGSAQGRADIICQMMTAEMDLLRKVTGNAHPLMKTVFYNEVADYMDHINTPEGFKMTPPTDPDLIWCNSSDQRDHFPTSDTTGYKYANYESGKNRFGYYFNFQFYNTGAHVAAAEGPWKVAMNHKMASQQSGPGNFQCSILNAGNVREFTMELAAGGDVLWNLSPGYDPNIFLTNFCAQYFGRANAGIVAALFSNYYNAYWQQKASDSSAFTNSFPRQFLFYDQRYARAARTLLSHLSRGTNNANPFNGGGPRFYRIVPADNGAPDELSATINGTTAAIDRFTAVVSNAEALYKVVPESGKPYFNDILRQPAHFMLEANRMLQGLAQALARLPSGRDAERPWLTQAQAACEGMQNALDNTTQGPVFGGWYGKESKFNVAEVRNLVDAALSADSPVRP